MHAGQWFYLALALLLATAVATAAADTAPPAAIDPGTIGMLVFRAGEHAAGIRTRGVPRLKCTSPVREADQPREVTCTNAGLDDAREVIWRCEAQLPPTLRLGRAVVSWEAYPGKDSRTVLPSSAALEYELLPVAPPVKPAHTVHVHTDGASPGFGTLLWLLMIPFAVIGVGAVLLLCAFASQWNDTIAARQANLAASARSPPPSPSNSPPPRRSERLQQRHASPAPTTPTPAPTSMPSAGAPAQPAGFRVASKSPPDIDYARLDKRSYAQVVPAVDYSPVEKKTAPAPAPAENTLDNVIAGVAAGALAAAAIGALTSSRPSAAPAKPSNVYAVATPATHTSGTHATSRRR
jgi:hypothetical protein